MTEYMACCHRVARDSRFFDGKRRELSGYALILCQTGSFFLVCGEQTINHVLVFSALPEKTSGELICQQVEM